MAHAADPEPMRIAVVGEALIDFTCSAGLAFEGREGGAPANSAIAAARLGVGTGFIGQLSTDLFGERLLANLQANRVDTRFVLRSAAPTTLAFVERTAATNRYAFYLNGSADTLWAPPELPVLPESCRLLQFGSIALLHEPAASRIVELAQAQHDAGRLVLLDPNVRPSLIRDMAAYRRRFDGWLRCCDVLKLSDEDAALLAPDAGVDGLAAALLERGPRLVVVTRGGAGASLFRAGRDRLDLRAPRCDVVDTIGAGDTFGAALAVALLEHDALGPRQLDALTDAQCRAVLRFATLAAALNCTRAGADPPSRAQLDAALASAID